MASVLCSCGAEVLYDGSESRCPHCGADIAELAKDAISRRPSPGFRRAIAMGEIPVYQKPDTTSTVVGKLQKSDRVAVGPDCNDGRGHKWVEVQMASRQSWRTRPEQGFVLKSSQLSVPSPALGLGILGVGVVLLVAIIYQVVRGNSVSIPVLAMIALGIYGAFAKRK